MSPLIESEALRLLREEFDAERVETERQLRAERYGAPTLLTETRCYVCNDLLVQNDRGMWCHLGATNCPHPVVSLSEVTR